MLKNNKLSLKKGTIALFTAISVMIPTIAWANPYIEQVAAQLILIGLKYIQAGWTSSHDPYFNSLRANNSYYVPYYLSAGNTYSIFGVCDEDCSDIDLSIYDDKGNLISRDNSGDDIPLVSVRVIRSSYFQVKVRMYNCNTTECVYGLSAFKK